MSAAGELTAGSPALAGIGPFENVSEVYVLGFPRARGDRPGREG